AVVIFWFQARQQIGEMQLVWANVTNRRETAVQHMVDTFEAARLLDRHQAVRLFDDANHRMVPSRRGTETARVYLRMIVADRTKHNAFFDFEQRRNQAFDIRLRHAHHVKSEPLRRLLPDAWQALELIDQFRNWFSVL